MSLQCLELLGNADSRFDIVPFHEASIFGRKISRWYEQSATFLELLE